MQSPCHTVLATAARPDVQDAWTPNQARVSRLGQNRRSSISEKAPARFACSGLIRPAQARSGSQACQAPGHLRAPRSRFAGQANAALSAT
jgi:hypothetical protein